MALSKGYFAGANGERGFVSYFEGALSDTKGVYILKGGCGCGKSALMKKLAAEAERRGEAVERIYCASDPNSLDGVVLTERRLAVADGTAPHEISPRLPGAADCIVNLGECWDAAVLRQRRGEIKALADKKEAAIRRAYSLLAAAGCLTEEKLKLLENAVLWDKMYAAVNRLIKKLAPGGAEFSASVRLRSAFCAAGKVNAPDYGEKSLVPVKDSYGIAHLFFEQLLAAAYGKGLKVAVSPSPLSPSRIDGLLIEDTGVLIAVEEDYDSKPVNLERFIDKAKLAGVRGKLRFINKTVNTLTDEARTAMAESRAAHAALEDIYTPAMDFEKVNGITAKLMAEIFA